MKALVILAPAVLCVGMLSGCGEGAEACPKIAEDVAAMNGAWYQMQHPQPDQLGGSADYAAHAYQDAQDSYDTHVKDCQDAGGHLEKGPGGYMVWTADAAASPSDVPSVAAATPSDVPSVAVATPSAVPSVAVATPSAPIAPRFVNAVHQCGGLPEIILVDEGNAIHMTVGGTTEFDVTKNDAVCVLTKLNMPRSMRAKLIGTNSPGDVQTERWDGIEANWLYDSFIGLDILLQPANTP